MSTIVEKLAAIEKEVAAIQPKMEPLSGRITDLHNKLTGFTQQLADLIAESAAVKQDVELTQQSLGKIQKLIGESKTESEQLAAGQEENIQRCETMTAVFGTAFQAVSQFFETAQRMGLADQAKAVFTLPPTSAPAMLPHSEPADSRQSEYAEQLPDVPPAPDNSDAANDTLDSNPIAEEPIVEEPIETEAEPEPVLSESDFDSVLPQTEPAVLDPVSMPNLPDVAAVPELGTLESDAAEVHSEADSMPSEEIASQLEVPPLNLSVPELPAVSEPATETEEEQDIEAMLASMMTPVTAGAGN